VSHQRLEQRAIREGWNLSPETRAKIIARLEDDLHKPDIRPRHMLAVAKTLIQADLRQQEIDLKRGEQGITLASIAREMADADDEHSRRQEDDCGPAEAVQG
jgi:hypothetical protein